MVWRNGLLCLMLLILVISGSASAADSADDEAWQVIVPGIEYRQFQLSDPNNVFVARMDRNNPSVILDTSIAQGKLSDGKETVSDMYNRYDQALNFWGASTKPPSWGMRNKVVVAINGSYYDIRTGAPQGGIIQSGWYAKRYDNLGGWGGFTWKLDRSVFISECLYHIPEKQFVTYPETGVTQEIGDINHPPKASELVLYTPQYDSRTGTDNSGTEVQVELTYPETIFPKPASISGIVRSIDNDMGNNLIPFNSVVISARGVAAHTLLDNIHIGSEVRITQEITSYEYDCVTPYSLSWTKTYASIQGAYFFLKNGQIFDFDDPGAVRRNPRTAIAYDDQYVYFVVVDGRNSYYSVGMTIHELGVFLRDTLGATWGVAQDGGGSSTMVINGQVVNNSGCNISSCSGYSGQSTNQRPVANGMLMVVAEPAEFSLTFIQNNSVTTRVDTELRLGPGTNYDSFITIPMGTQGTVTEQINNLNGIMAKSSFWWYVDFGGTKGWLPEEALVVPDLRWEDFWLTRWRAALLNVAFQINAFIN